MRKIASLLLVLFVSGCVSIGEEPQWNRDIGNSSDLVVYRESGSHSKALKAYFGSSANYVVSLREKEYVKMHLPTGEHEFRVKANGSASTTLSTKLMLDRKTCIKLKADPAQWVGAAIPIVGMAMPAFSIEEVSCPEDEYFSSFKKVEVQL